MKAFQPSQKLMTAGSDLRLALEKKNPGRLDRLAITKAFEIAVQYAWRDFKKLAQDEGYEIQSPKEAVRKAATLGLIPDATRWIDFINTRNLSTRDYLGIDPETFIELAQELLVELEKLLKV